MEVIKVTGENSFSVSVSTKEAAHVRIALKEYPSDNYPNLLDKIVLHESEINDLTAGELIAIRNALSCTNYKETFDNWVMSVAKTGITHENWNPYNDVSHWTSDELKTIQTRTWNSATENLKLHKAPEDFYYPPGLWKE